MGGAGEQVGTCVDDTRLAYAALSYAAHGWRVFPLHTPTSIGPKRGEGSATCSCGGAECENQGKHPRTSKGLHDATTDAAVVTAWWTRWPDANIGLPTGLAFDVLDLDGADALDALDEAAPDGAGTIIGPIVVTGRGVHIYVEPTGANNRAGFLPSIDWRGAGGYVVAPPSLHHLGHRYEWSPGYDAARPIEPAPRWLAALVHHKVTSIQHGRPSIVVGSGGSRYGLRALEGELGRLVVAQEGTRNDALVRSAFKAGQLVAGGELDPLHAATELLVVAQRIGLGDHEAERTISSGMSSGAGSPRTAS